MYLSSSVPPAPSWEFRVSIKFVLSLFLHSSNRFLRIDIKQSNVIKHICLPLFLWLPPENLESVKFILFLSLHSSMKRWKTNVIQSIWSLFIMLFHSGYYRGLPCTFITTWHRKHPETFLISCIWAFGIQQFWLGTIHILRRQVLGLFLTHPSTTI